MPPIFAQIDTDQIDDLGLRDKVTSVVGTLQDLFDWVVHHKNELTVESFFVQSLQNPRTIHNSQQMLNRLKDVMTKVAGNINGYHKELELASRQIQKAEIAANSNTKRAVHFGSRGDVAIDYGLGYGKAIQSKSCFASGYTDVDNHIKKAALQLTGEKVQAETPGAFDRRVVDISIRNSQNRWPKTDADFSPLKIENVVDRVHNCVATYVKGTRGYNKWGELTSNVGISVGTGSKGAHSRTLYANTLGGTSMAIDFVVKIRWAHARQMLVNGSLKAVTQITTRTELAFGAPKTSWILYKST